MAASNYTTDQVSALLASRNATMDDYLAQLYLQIFNITTGPVYNKFRLRFNNIIFNNNDEITRILKTNLMYPMGIRVLSEKIQTISAYSFIYNEHDDGSQPVIVQYFDKTVGIKWGILGRGRGGSSVVNRAVRSETIGKVVGYCGDYCLREPNVRNDDAEHIRSLRSLSGRNVFDLPRFEGFTEMLFDVLLSYLPVNIVEPLVLLGKILSNMRNSHQQLIKHYKAWEQSKEHILNSKYTEQILQHWHDIFNDLLLYKCLPSCVTLFFTNLSHLFFVYFMRTVYVVISELKLSENNAVLYYSNLKKLIQTCQQHEHNPVPQDPLNYLQHLSDSCQMRKEDLETLHGQVMEVSSATFRRAYIYLENQLPSFPGFDYFLWVLLEESLLDFDDVHASYHTLKIKADCTHCHVLHQEVKTLNATIARSAIMEVNGIAKKWVYILKECQVPIVTELVEILLSLPASCSMVEGFQGMDLISSIIRLNFNDIPIERVMSGKLWWGSLWHQAEKMFLNNKIERLEE